METVDLTVELLKQIRDSAHETNARLLETNAHLAETNARLDRTRTEFLEKIGEVRGDIVRLDARVEKLDARVGKLEERMGTFEGQLSQGLGYVRILAERDERLATEVADIRRRVEVLEASRPPNQP